MQIAATTAVGHNVPPPLRQVLAENYASLAADVDAIAVRANDAPRAVTSDDDLGRVGDLVKDVRLVAKRVDAARVAEKEPHLTAGREIDAFFKGMAERLDRIGKTLESRATEYQRAKAAEERRRREEEARKAREEEERQREIAARAAEANRSASAAKAEHKAEVAGERAREAEAAAQAKAADLTRTRSETGTVATARTEWAFELIDATAIPLEPLRPYIPRADLEKAIRSFVRMGGRELAGVRIYEDVRASFR